MKSEKQGTDHCFLIYGLTDHSTRTGAIMPRQPGNSNVSESMRFLLLAIKYVGLAICLLQLTMYLGSLSDKGTRFNTVFLVGLIVIILAIPTSRKRPARAQSIANTENSTVIGEDELRTDSASNMISNIDSHRTMDIAANHAEKPAYGSRWPTFIYVVYLVMAGLAFFLAMTDPIEHSWPSALAVLFVGLPWSILALRSESTLLLLGCIALNVLITTWLWKRPKSRKRE